MTQGLNPNGKMQTLKVDADGALIVAGGTGGGGGGGGGTSTTTEATQLLVRAAVEAINTKTPTLGRKAASGSTPVTLPSDIPTDLVADSAGTLFSPGSCSHAYGYDGSGNLTTDTATDGAVVRVKTLAYTSGNLTSETKWVVQ